MCSIMAETEKLSALLISAEQMKAIDEMVAEITINKNYDTEPLWKLDSELGTSFQSGTEIENKSAAYPYDDERSIYTPLQYARDEIEICNISYSSRYVISYSLMHLEAVLRYVIKRNILLGSFRFRNVGFNKAVLKLKDLGIVPENMLQAYYIFTELNAKLKHGADVTDLFCARDALVTYLGARILGIRTIECFQTKHNIRFIRKSDSPYFKYYIL